MSDYRRPGVYLEERLQTQPVQTGGATAVGVFAGVTPKGPGNQAVRVESWSDFVQKFGGFDTVLADTGTGSVAIFSYLPYAVFNYYQNGGRVAYIVRVLPANTLDQGTAAEVDVDDGEAVPAASMTITAAGAGTWGNDLEVRIAKQTDAPGDNSSIFSMTIVSESTGQVLESFSNLSMRGTQGTRPVAGAINDPVAGSRYIRVAPDVTDMADPKPATYDLIGGVDPKAPVEGDLTGTPVVAAMRTIDNPLLVSFQPFVDATGVVVVPTPSAVTSSLNSERHNVFVIWDGHPLSKVTGGDYKADAITLGGSIGQAESYAALYVPWVITPDPAHAGATITVPPSGSVAGMMARVDATVGPWRAPAGIPAVLSTSVATEVKFTDTDQGELNSQNINVIRAVPGGGICVMGGRTRKLYGPDRYVNDRRTLIYIEESIKLSTQWAVFENNDQRLWSSLRDTVRRLLQPIWEAGGLAGASAAQAYYVTCDSTINVPQVVQAGEVRMEVGVALQYPAEFVIIRISQFDSGSTAVTEIVTA